MSECSLKRALVPTTLAYLFPLYYVTRKMIYSKCSLLVKDRNPLCRFACDEFNFAEMEGCPPLPTGLKIYFFYIRKKIKSGALPRPFINHGSLFLDYITRDIMLPVAP